MLNRTGEKMYPCGTLQVRGLEVEVQFPILGNWTCPSRRAHTILAHYRELLPFLSGESCKNSRRMRMNVCPLSIGRRRSSISATKVVSIPYPGLNQDYSRSRTLASIRWACNWPLAGFSMNLLRNLTLASSRLELIYLFSSECIKRGVHSSFLWPWDPVLVQLLCE